MVPKAMDCPKCDRIVAPGSQDCPECGIVFARWQNRVSQRRILPPDRAEPVLSRQNRTGLRVLVWTGILIAVVGVGSEASRACRPPGAAESEPSPHRWRPQSRKP